MQQKQSEYILNEEETSHLVERLNSSEQGQEAKRLEKKSLKAPKPAKSPKRPKAPKAPGQSRKWLLLLIVGIISLLGGVACIIIAVFIQTDQGRWLDFPQLPSQTTTSDIQYSKLTGERLSDASLINAPTYCVQTPNGTDGARPQAGLDHAGVVFEAIAEAGITRFAAIYQNPTTAIIGPVRSLRIYYLEWDTPFDCTIVHAGGSGDALAAVSAGGYRDLSEDYAYMYRGTVGSRLWNNLFTTSAYLRQFNLDHGYDSSNVQGFTRMTPEESEKSRIDHSVKEHLNITKPTKVNTSELEPQVTEIGLRLGGWANFNVNYSYDAHSNRYFRSYESGAAHEVYDCEVGDLGEQNPESACNLVQLAPYVVIAMKVEEGRASDNYHEDITTIGSGEAYIFQNGSVIRGTWSKPSKADQITFLDTDGEEIKLAPGQTFVTAVPNYGSVDF